MTTRLQPGKHVNLITGYSTGDNEDLSFGYIISLAQTFIITEPSYIFRTAALLFTKIGNPGIHAYLLHADEDGRPIGWPIATSWTKTTANYEEPFTWWWVHEFRNPVPLLTPGKYAVVYETLNPGHFLFWRWRLHDSPPPPIAPSWRSLNFGGTWNELVGWTFIHELWGWHPPPEEPPQDEPIYWAPIDEEELAWDDSFTIVVTTESPCHLYMRWTLEPPLKHKITRVVRGITLSNETRYCFVAFHENEQIEPGDTLVHTFVKPHWPICQTRYFYFIGSKQRQTSPSASPIFSLHRETIEMPSQLITPDGEGDILQLSSTDFLHWEAVLDDDSVWVPANGGGPWGRLSGHYISKGWFPWGYQTDLFHFTRPLWCDLPITLLTIHYKLCRDNYPYGKWRPVIRTHDTTYYGPETLMPGGFYWTHHSYPTNPFTGAPWTHQEVADVQAGIALNKVGSFGALYCDAIHIELNY